MTDLTENLEELFDLSVNKSDGNRKKKKAGKNMMTHCLARMHSRPKWRQQLAAIRAHQTKKNKHGD